MTDRPRLPSENPTDPAGDFPEPTIEASAAAPPDNLVLVGRVLAAWGLRGEMRIWPVSTNPDRFRQGRRLLVNGESRRIITSRSHGRGQIVLLLDGITTPEMAAAFRGADLFVREEDAPPLDEDWYYHFQLLGLKVVTDDGRELGVLVQVLETGANDVYIVRNDTREYLIPAIADVVQQVDLEAQRMTIHPLPGLLD